MVFVPAQIGHSLGLVNSPLLLLSSMVLLRGHEGLGKGQMFPAY